MAKRHGLWMAAAFVGAIGMVWTPAAMADDVADQIGKLDNANRAVRQAAADYLVAHPDAAVEALKTVARDGNASLRRRVEAVRILGDIAASRLQSAMARVQMLRAAQGELTAATARVADLEKAVAEAKAAFDAAQAAHNEAQKAASADNTPATRDKLREARSAANAAERAHTAAQADLGAAQKTVERLRESAAGHAGELEAATKTLESLKGDSHAIFAELLGSDSAGLVKVPAVQALAKIPTAASSAEIVRAIGLPMPPVQHAAMVAAGDGRVVDALPALAERIAQRGNSPELAVVALRAGRDILVGHGSNVEGATAFIDAASQVIANGDDNTESPVLYQAAAFALGAIRHEAALFPLQRLAAGRLYTRAADAKIIADKEKQREAGANNGGNGDGDNQGQPENAEQPTTPNTNPATNPGAEQPAPPSTNPEHNPDAVIVDSAEHKALRQHAEQQDRVAAQVAARMLAKYGVDSFFNVQISLTVNTADAIAADAFETYCTELGAPVLPRLMKVLIEENAHARSVAARTIQSIIRQNPDAVAYLQPITELEGAAVLALIPHLHKVQTAAAVDVFAPLVLEGTTASAELRRETMKLFAAMMGGTQPGQSSSLSRKLDAQTVIAAGVARLSDDDPAVREAAIATLQAAKDFVADREALSDKLNQRILVETEGKLIGQLAELFVAVRSAQGAGADQQAAGNAVLELLKRVSDVGPRTQLFATLQKLPDTLKPQIVQAVRGDLLAVNGDLGLRKAAVDVLAWAGTPDALNAMRDVLQDDGAPLDLKTAIVDKLKVMGTSVSAIVPALVDFTGKTAAKYEAARKAESAEVQTLRSLLREAMYVLSLSADPRAVSALTPFVAPRTDGLDVAALRDLQQLSTNDAAAKQIVPVVLDGFGKLTADPMMAELAAKMENVFPLVTARAARELRAAADRGTYRVAALEIFLIAPLGVNTPKVLRLAYNLLDHGDEAVVRLAVDILGKHKWGQALRKFAELWHARPALRPSIEAAAKQIRPNWTPSNK